MTSQEFEELQNNASYWAMVPAPVRYDNQLKPMEKLMFSEISAQSNQYGFCNLNNEYFAKSFGVSKSTVSRWISDLKSKEYIVVKIFYKENTKEILQRRIYVNI